MIAEMARASVGLVQLEIGRLTTVALSASATG